MVRTAVVCLMLLIALSSLSEAISIRPATLAEMTERAVCIVAGRVVKRVTTERAQGLHDVVCFIRVDQTIKGAPHNQVIQIAEKKTAVVTIQFQDGENAAKGKYQLRDTVHHIGQEGIWFLHLKEGATAPPYVAAREDLSKLGKVKELLQNKELKATR